MHSKIFQLYLRNNLNVILGLSEKYIPGYVIFYSNRRIVVLTTDNNIKIRYKNVS